MREKPVTVRPLPIATIMHDLADFLHKEPPDPEVLVGTLSAGIVAAQRNGTAEGLALAALLAAIGETNSAIFGQFAERFELAAEPSVSRA